MERRDFLKQSALTAAAAAATKISTASTTPTTPIAKRVLGKTGEHLSMIGFGFTLAKLFQSLADAQVLIRGPAGRVWTAEGVGMLLISLGTLALIVAIFDHHRELKQLRAAGLEARFSLTTAVASVLAILGVMALLSLLAYT